MPMSESTLAEPLDLIVHPLLNDFVEPPKLEVMAKEVGEQSKTVRVVDIISQRQEKAYNN